MKFERISENQIRCTLNKADLADRDLLLNELAYGTEKAKALFREMMQQASYEVGFEAEDIPLMIEAIPVNPDCLVLIITKVEDPEELDTRFSKFTKPVTVELEGDLEEDTDYPEEEDEEDIATIYDKSKDEPLPFGPGNIGEALDFLAPITNAIKQAHEAAREKKEKAMEEKAVQKLYYFTGLKPLIQASTKLSGFYKETNMLYRDKDSRQYYLLVTKGDLSSEEFSGVCNLITEYGQKVPNTYATDAYLREHHTILIDGNAISVLSAM